MRKSILILAAALLWTIPAAADETVRAFSKQLPTEDIQKVDLDFPVGEITLDAWDSQSLQLDVRLECHRDSNSCREAAQKVRLVYSTANGTLHVEIKSWPKLSGHGLEAHVHARIPRDLPLDADLGVGEMHLAGFTGDVKANLGVGELRLTLPASAVSTVHADTGVGEANLTARGHHYQSAGLFTKELRWSKGTGASKVSADCGVGEIQVRLE